MPHGGLVSITFRQLTPEQVVELMGRTELTRIEWGGDVHAPHGDADAADRVAELTRNAGLTPCTYGSYYRCGVSEDKGLCFLDVLDSARRLGAPDIRVWAGDLGTQNADDAHWERVVHDARRVADHAARDGIGLVFEYHAGTLTDTHEAAVKLLHLIDRPNVRLGWQPVPVRTHEQNQRDLGDLLDRGGLATVHAFQWTASDRGVVRHPLADGESEWRDYLRQLNDADVPVLIEFVKGNAPEQFLADAAALSRWLSR